MIDQAVGLVAHLPLNAILKGSQGVEFELVAVELAGGHLAAEGLYELANLNLSHAFQIAAPSPPSPSVDVEQPAGGDVGTANASPPPATLDELRELVRTTFSDEQKVWLDGYLRENRINRKNANDVRGAVALAMRAERTVQTWPDAMDRDVDEGYEVDDDVKRDVGQAYARLPDDKRSWVSMAKGDIYDADGKIIGGPLLLGGPNGKQTERRATLLGALCELADQGMDDDDAVRAIAAHLIGDIAWQAGNTTGDVVAALDVAEAHRFAAIASLVCMSLAPFEFVEGQAARCVLTSELAAA